MAKLTLKDIAGKLKEKLQASFGINDNKPFVQSPVGQKFVNFNRNASQAYTKNILQPIANAPRFEFARKPIENKALSFGRDIALGIPESFVNIPRNLAAGAARLEIEKNKALMERQRPNLRNIASGIAPIAEAGLDFASFGVGSNIAKQGAKQLIKGGIKQAAKKGAVSGGLYGATGGLTYGIDRQYGKEFSGKQLAGDVATGAALGGVLGGGLAGSGAFFQQVMNGVKKLNPKLSQKQVQEIAGAYLRDKAGRFAKQAVGYRGVMPDKVPYEPIPLTQVSDNKMVPSQFAGLYKNLDKNLNIPENFDIKRIKLGAGVKEITPEGRAKLQSTKGVESMPVKKTGVITTESIGLNKQLQSQIDVVPSKPIIPLSQKLNLERQNVLNTKVSNTVTAEINRSVRDSLSSQSISDINLIKRISKGEKFKVGDVETFRREYPQLTDKVVESVREVPQYSHLTDSEALDVALSLPTKQMTIAKRVETTTQKALEREYQIASKLEESITGKPITKTEFEKINKDANTYFDELEKGIIRNKGGVVSIEPKIKTNSSKLKEQQFIEQNRLANKALYGEYGVKPLSKSVKDIEKIIKSSTNQGILENSDSWKDKPKVFLTRETMERNIEDVAGKDAPIIKEKLLQPIFKAEADRTKFLNRERAEIKNLGIKARSKESGLVQLLGEGKINKSQLPKESAEKIIKAESVLRQKYDQYLTQLNKVLTRNGYDPIPKRKDYFHHFEDLNGAFEQIGVAIKANDLPTDINGLSADFKPGKTFFTAALQRKGDQTAVDAITGIDKYLDGASNQIYHTDNIQNLRAFETAIREKYAGTEHLTNFVADLGEYTNSLAGKKGMVDRAAESIFGRKIYSGANALRRQTGANMVGANFSSALTNFIPVTQTLATTSKPSVAQSMLSILKNVFKDDGFIDKSNFLTSRIGSDRLSMTNWEKVGQGGNVLFKLFDSFTSQLAVRSKYLDGIKKGLPEKEAMRFADEWGRKILGGRSAGEVPTLFNSKTLGFFTQFQLEVNNQLSFMTKDIPRNFSKVGAASALGQLFLYSYVYNTLFEKLAGRRPAFDPIGVVQDTYEDYTNPNMKKGQATKNTIKRVADQLPFASALEGGRIPIGSAIPNPMAVVKGESTVGKELKKPLYYLLSPTGGGQIKKFIEGTKAYNQGASLTDSGNVRYPIPQTIGNKIKTGIFGQYSTPEAQQYFREGRLPLGEKQSAFFKESAPSDKESIYNKVISNRQKDTADTSGDTTSTTKGNIYKYMDDGGSVKEIDLSFPLKTYTPTGNATLDKELLADYKGSITKTKNDIMKAWEVGAIDQGQAITELEKLVTAGNKTKAAKKPKKITLKVSSYKAPKITIKRRSSTKLPTIKFKKPKKTKIVRRYTIK